MTTTQDLLVGPATTVAPTTTATAPDLTSSAVTKTGGNSDPKVWFIVAVLVVIAIGLGVATLLYWRRTRPEDPTAPPGSRRSSRYADLMITTPETD